VQEAGRAFQRDLGAQPDLDALARDANRALVELNQNYEEIVRTLERVIAEREKLAAELRQANEVLSQLGQQRLGRLARVHVHAGGCL
jgi:hypothetical protein